MTHATETPKVTDAAPSPQTRGHAGGRHWWLERMSSVVLLPLTLFLAIGIAMVVPKGYDAALAWLTNPIVEFVVILALAATFYHTALGCRVIAEDYIHDQGARAGVIQLVNVLCVALALAGSFAVLSLNFSA